MNHSSGREFPVVAGNRVRRGRARTSRALVVVGLSAAAVLSPLGLGRSGAAEPTCPTDSLCLFPQADFAGKPKIVHLPKSPLARARMSDDAACLRVPVGSLIDNSPSGGTTYANAKCDDGGKSLDFTAGARMPKFPDWPGRSVVYPTD